MAEYQVRDPSGALRVISGPDGATDAEIIAQAQKLFGGQQANAAQEKPLMVDVARNAMYGGLAAVPDALLNTPNRLLNLGKARVGLAMDAIGISPQNFPQPTPDPNYTDRLFRSIGLIKEGATPQGAGQKAADVLLRGGVAGAITGGGGVGSIAGAGLGALSAGSDAVVTDVTKSPVAGAIAGMAVPAAAANVPGIAASGAERLMRSAVKPTLRDVQRGNADRGIRTLLDEGINVTPNGALKLRDRIDVINDRLNTIIQNSTASVDPAAVAARLGGVRDRFGRQVDPQNDLAAIANVESNWQNHPLIAGRPSIPVQEAQQLKQGTYQTLRGQYGERGSASVESSKALARGLKEEIARVVPEVSALNAREGALLNAANLVDRRLAVEGNKNPIGLGALATSPLKTAAFMADRSGATKSVIARALNTAGRIPVDMERYMISIGIPLSAEMNDSQKRQVLRDYAQALEQRQ